jgi:DNA-binding XRE family transcriptional regulator
MNDVQRFQRDMGRRLRRLRDASQHTQLSLATALGWDKSTIAKIESGKAKPSLLLAIDISRYFGVSLDVFLGLEENADLFDVSVYEINRAFQLFRATHQLPPEAFQALIAFSESMDQAIRLAQKAPRPPSGAVMAEP